MKKLKIAYQGVPGSYSYQAMHEHFGKNIDSINKPLFGDVFEDVVNGSADYGIIPFENSTTGGVYEVFDLLISSHAYIVGERCIEVRHNLMGIKGSSLSDIKTVYSHQQALDQCSRYIRSHEFSSIPTTNTAVSAKLVNDKKDRTCAAIGSELAGEIYDLEVLATGINNYFNNITKFIIISSTPNYVKDADKISLYFTTPHKPGALYNSLGIFAKNDINLLKLISRPTRNTPWAYSYFVDVEGNLNHQNVREALSDLESLCPQFKILGNYKAHTIDV
ncbi:MAG TPA: prephenate dehydratase [Eubacteriaceae bacterium]|jgi:chorismate mutase/prephenate dehydratase|nr:prephenate dehydratase [Eubacteriaceae bacterium]